MQRTHYAVNIKGQVQSKLKILLLLDVAIRYVVSNPKS